ncbi:hypothetical protein [Gordonia sp. NPDC058843]|uniref:hypothetical protein n=1 Tax=Gordonia sp. NPDC058843 TaxID=3346648 RepID=UPI0036C06BD8
MNDPTQPPAHRADAAADAQNPDDAATRSPDRAPTEPIAPDDDRRAPATDAPVGPAPQSAPVDRKTAPARSALIAGAAGLAIVAGALGFGAGYITGDTTSERPTPGAVWQQGGNGTQMGQHGMGDTGA